MADDKQDGKQDNKQAAKNAAKSAAEIKKQKKKKWCPILAPESFHNRVIGESLLDDASLLMKRVVTVNMMQLANDMKKQNINISFKVIDVKEGKGITQPIKFEISLSSLRRLAKREKNKLQDSFVVKTLDNKLVRLKPIMVTNNMTKGSVKAALIKTCRAVCKELINKTNFDQLIPDLVAYSFQKQIKEALHTTYPLRHFDVRMLKLETKKKKETVEEEELLKLKKKKEEMEAEKKEVAEVEQKSVQADDDEQFSDQTEETEESEEVEQGTENAE